MNVCDASSLLESYGVKRFLTRAELLAIGWVATEFDHEATWAGHVAGAYMIDQNVHGEVPNGLPAQTLQAMEILDDLYEITNIPSYVFRSRDPDLPLLGPLRAQADLLERLAVICLAWNYPARVKDALSGLQDVDFATVYSRAGVSVSPYNDVKDIISEPCFSSSTTAKGQATDYSLFKGAAIFLGAAAAVASLLYVFKR